ncbi:MAG: ABC-F family ATP-binding cassette domain-containing protein [Armatimonadetes bacterium]|nr:ABC-F family ATP-binding cassette domain-containing protein [Armatimonadota bacterium]
MTVLLSCQSLTKSYGDRPLFRNITFGIRDDERLGLIGPNGAGKSTLLKLFVGLEKPDGGTISARRGLRLGYVPQAEEFAPGRTVADVLADALADTPLDVTEKAVQIDITLARVGFASQDEPAHTLSGGWKKRLAIAQALVQEPDVLLMDEPTNHLDLEGVLWLEEMLKTAPFAFVVISHDRYFLEHVGNRIMELNPAYADGFLSVPGPYSDFLAKREEHLEAQAHREAALQTQVRREIEWLRRGAQARTTKQQARVQEAGRLMDDLAEVRQRNAQGRAAGIEFSASGRKTRDLLAAKDLAARVEGRTLFSGLDLALAPRMRLGLLGPNGSGKTTLLRILTGERPPDAGTIKRADGLRVVFFDQSRERLDTSLTLREALSPNGETVTYRGNAVHVSGWAKRFLFASDQLNRPLSRFSGGEQARVLIARLMLQPADLLILDEPTNDLDIPTLEVLEDSLAEFPGALVLVTHDRLLLDQVSTEVLALDGRGGARFYADYDQWEQHQRRPTTPEPVKRAASPAPRPRPPAANRMTTAERREWKQMEEKIEAVEARVEALKREMEDPSVASDPVRLPQCWQDLQDAEAEVARLYARWEELDAKQG